MGQSMCESTHLALIPESPQSLKEDTQPGETEYTENEVTNHTPHCGDKG